MEIKPMLLVETFDLKALEDKSQIFQEKFNGVRAMVHIKNNRVIGIRNRSNNPILYMFPEFRELDFPFDTAILDCEICVMKNGKSVFYGGIDKRRSLPTETVLKEYPATMVVFDALHIGTETIVMKPYKYRYELVGRSIGTWQNEKFKFAMNYDPKELWDKVVKDNREGVVIKNPNAVYDIGKRSKDCIKLKNYKQTDIIIDKVEPNDKGTKIFGKFGEIDVECQLAGIFDVEVGSTQRIKYLDIVGNRLIQPTKIKREQVR